MKPQLKVRTSIRSGGWGSGGNHNRRALTVRENLKRAKKIVEKGWCQGFLATTKNGRRVNTFARSAALFCSWGAIKRAAGKSGDYYPALNAFELVVENVPRFNDAPGRTKAQVLAAFDRAIKAVR